MPDIIIDICQKSGYTFHRNGICRGFVLNLRDDSAPAKQPVGKQEVSKLPRPRKCRRVCHFPRTLAFSPDTGRDETAAVSPDTEGRSAVILTVDEYETIRLIDKESMSQEQCGELMQIARTTVQQIYANARRKLAEALVEGLPLRIEGGDFHLCDGREAVCGFHTCFKQKFNQAYAKSKGETVMRIAVTYENGEIFQHFGHTEQFKVYDIQDNKVISSEVVGTNGSGHGALAGVLQALNADVLICGGIGGGAQAALAAAGIRLYGGVSGNADDAVAALLSGSLNFNPDVHCDHHDHQHGEGHTCGSHGCQKHEHNCGGNK